jgi:drug/metabolite transporter (DMT)-like permease
LDRRSWLWLLLLASIWGASYMLIKIGLRGLSPEMVAFARIALAAAVLMPIAAAQGALNGLRGRLGMITLLGAVQVAGPFLLIPLGEQEISSALAALLAIGIAHEERSEGLRLFGVAIGLAGVVLLFGLDLTGSTASLLGGLAVVLAGLGYSIGGFIVKHRLSDARPLGVVASVMTSSAVLLVIPAAVSAPSSAPGLGPLAAVLALGVLGTGAAFVIFYLLLGTVGPARTMIVSYVAPGFALVYGGVLLGETITAASVAGLALIVGGSWLAAGGVSAPATEASPPELAPPLVAEGAARPDSAPRLAGDGAHRESRHSAPAR